MDKNSISDPRVIAELGAKQRRERINRNLDKKSVESPRTIEDIDIEIAWHRTEIKRLLAEREQLLAGL